MNKICPNLKNKEVAKEFNELLEATSENAAYHIWSENNGNAIDKAPNGEPSKLFTDLLSHFNGDRKLAIQTKARTFSKGFKTWFDESKATDENGEPLVLWHGTNYMFDEFTVDENNERGKHLVHDKHSFFFTTSKEKAFKYKRSITMPVFLRLNNPGESSVVEDNAINNVDKENAILANDEYDSAIFDRFDKEGDKNGTVPTTQYVAKSPNQIKSIDNNGEFSTASNNVYNYVDDAAELDDVIDNNIEIETEVFNDIRFGEEVDAKIVLKNALDKGYIADEFVEYAKKLIELGNLGKVTRQVFGADSKHLGNYDSKTGVTTIYSRTIEKGSRNRHEIGHVLLHELTHRFTINSFEFPTTAQEKRFRKDVIGMYNYFIKNVKDSDKYGFTDPLEFCAEVLSNEKFRKLLSDVNMKEDTLLNKFINALRTLIYNVVGIKFKKTNLENLINTIDSVVSSNLLKSDSELLREGKALTLNLTDQELQVNQIMFSNIAQQTNIDSAKLTNVAKIDKAYTDIIPQLALRIKDIKNAVNLDSKEIQNIELQLQLLNSLEAGQALIQYIPLMQNDITKVVTKINELNNAMLQAESDGTEIEISSAALQDIKRGFLGFYSSVITSMQDVLEDPASLRYLTSRGMSMKNVALYTSDLKRIAADYNNINRKYDNLVTYQATNNIIAYAKENGSTTINLLKKNILFADKDMSTIERLVYSPIHDRDELLAQLANRLVNAKNATDREVLRKGKDLEKLTNGMTKNEILSLFELTKDGKKTAHLVRPLNYGEFQMNKVAKQTELADEFGLTNIYERPKDRKQLMEYNRKINEWYDVHAERRFKKSYYDLFNGLSSEAAAAREAIQVSLNVIYHSVTDNKGKVHLEDLTDAQWSQALSLNKQKRDLANPYNIDGSAKIGTERDVAEELTKFNKTLHDKLTYKADLPRFKEAYLEAKKTLSKEKLETWVKRNTVKVVKQEFYDALAKLIEPRSDRFLKLKEERNLLQKLYKLEDGTIDADGMPDKAKAKIIEITAEMDILTEEETTKDEKKSALFSKVAKFVVNPGYTMAWEEAAEHGSDYLDRWVSLNTFKKQNKDGSYSIKPASFWTQLVPVDDKLYTYKPSSQWFSLDETSEFVNENFDQESTEFAIPKKSKYDNSTAYNKVRANGKTAALYDAVYNMLSESNQMIDFLYNVSNFRLPQIEANSFEIIGKANSIKSGLSTSLQHALAIRDTDVEYEGASPAVRSDGTYVKLIPTRYISALEDPNTITDDIVGSTIAYYSMALNHKNMRAIEPDLNLMVQQMGKRKTEGGISGTEMNVYKRATELLDMHLYGRKRQRGKNDEFTLFGKKISKSKLAFGFASFLRLSTLAHSGNVILTGLFTNKVNTRIEALTGEYFDSATLLRAAKEVAFSYPSMLASIGKVKTTNKLSSAMEYNQVVFNNADLFRDLHKSRVGRTLQKHFWYGGHAMVDYSTKGRLTASVYFNYKLYDGKFLNFSEFRTRNKNLDKKELKRKWDSISTTLYDAYEVKDERFSVKSEYANIVSTLLEDKIKNTISMIGSRIDGQLNDIDRASIHTNCYAAFFVMFRNFMIQMIQTRLKPAHFNYSKGNWDEGYLRATKNYIYRHVFNVEKLTQLKELCDNFEELDEMEKTAVRRVASEVIINLLLFSIFSQLLSGLADDDKRDWFKAEIAYLATRTRLELSTPYNPLDVLNMFQNPTAAVPYLNTLATFGELLLNPHDKVGSGPYKGRTKLFKGVMKLTPGKVYYEMLDPNSKRRYLENQIMKSDIVGMGTKFITDPIIEQF